MSTIRLYMCLSVRGAIRDLQRRRSKKPTEYRNDAGRNMYRDEAINALMDELVQGHEVIPMHKGCGNPCKNSCQCKGFDYGENGGCPGYPLDQQDDAALGQALHHTQEGV